MPQLHWEEGLRVGVDVMDTDHREFVRLLGRLEEADPPTFDALFVELVRHTAAHFERENTLMETTGFPALAPHRAEHDRLLAELRGMAGRLAEGERAAVRRYLREDLPAWFLNHRNTMDYVTARFVQDPHGANTPACGAPCLGCAAP